MTTLILPTFSLSMLDHDELAGYIIDILPVDAAYIRDNCPTLVCGIAQSQLVARVNADLQPATPLVATARHIGPADFDPAGGAVVVQARGDHLRYWHLLVHTQVSAMEMFPTETTEVLQ